MAQHIKFSSLLPYDEASENHIIYLTELEFKVTSIKSIYSYVDLLDSKNVCESFVLKSNSVVISWYVS